MVLANPYQEYRRTQIMTSPPERLVAMLYEGALRAIEHARASAARQEWSAFQESTLKAQSIIDELLMSLDLEKGGEIGHSLQSLYLWSRSNLMEGSIERDLDKIESAQKVISQLKEAWLEACQPQTQREQEAAPSRSGTS